MINIVFTCRLLVSYGSRVQLVVAGTLFSGNQTLHYEHKYTMHPQQFHPLSRRRHQGRLGCCVLCCAFAHANICCLPINRTCLVAHIQTNHTQTTLAIRCDIPTYSCRQQPIHSKLAHICGWSTNIRPLFMRSRPAPQMLPKHGPYSGLQPFPRPVVSRRLCCSRQHKYALQYHIHM